MYHEIDCGKKKKNSWIISVLKPEEKRRIRRTGLGKGVGRRVWSQTVGTLKAKLLTITIHTLLHFTEPVWIF